MNTSITIRQCMAFVLTCIFFTNLSFAQHYSKLFQQASIWAYGDLDREKNKLLNFNPLISVEQQKVWKHEIDELKQATFFTVFINGNTLQEEGIWTFADEENTIALTTQNIELQGTKKLLYEKYQPAENNSKAQIHTYTQGVGWIPQGKIPEQPKILQLHNDVAELMVFQSILNPEDRAIVQSYLALKYGITVSHEYVNTDNRTLWKPNTIYSHRIAGIGRDEGSGLNQKQSVAFGDTINFTVALNQMSQTNNNNEGTLEDQDFLIWADNGLPVTFLNNPSHKEVNLIERQWLIRAHGNINTQRSEVRMSAPTILEKIAENRMFVLMIDRSGQGDFSLENVELISPSSITKNGVSIFKEIQWDFDGSGTDAFTFGSVPSKVINDQPAILEFEEFPNPTSSGHYSLKIVLQKPSDIEVEIYDINQRLLESHLFKGQSFYRIPGKIEGASGTYTIRLKIGDEIFTKKLVLQ